MKAEERKRLERNELAVRLSDYWSGFSSTSPRATRVWTIVLIALIGVLAWVIYSRFTSRAEANRWTQLVFAGDTDNLNRIVKEDPGSLQAAIARLQIARAQMNEALSTLADRQPEKRLAAANKLKDAKKAYAEL